ncbi:class I adenylate-forming enzyme family protein [Paenibacillus sp. SI8]|uniref:class I adenylate-forming enzyme family protein n=1 Tax=unclassified Paenibacillus TaxID=185978 RepID=UPI003467DBE6
MNNHKLSPWSLFQESYDKYRDRTMLIYNDIEFTYADMFHEVQAFAQLIEKWSFTMGGVFLPNCNQWIASMLAMNKQKKAFVSLSYQFKGEALIELINYTDIELLVTDAKGFEAMHASLDSLNIRVVLVLQPSGSYEIHEFQDKAPREINGITEDTFGICFTSGSTSRPKGIVLSNRAITGNALAIAEHLNFTSEDRTIIPRSLAQASPLAGDVLMAISRGGSIILLNNLFHPAIFLRAIHDYKATQFYIVRTMLLQVLEYPQRHNYDISSLKRVLIGGMVNSLAIYRDAAATMPSAKIYNAYGTSEAVARVSFGEHDEVTKLSCVIGKPIKGCQITVYREDGTEAAIGETGELYIQSDYVMDGYYKSEHLTGEVLTSRGIRVRDTGYQDKNGLFYVLSRNDDMIMQGGSRVYPIDIEEVLLKHDGVKEVVALGIDDDKLGQKVIAFVCLKDGVQLQVKELYRWCISQLEDRKVPKEIYIVDMIPRNVIGKINKNEVKALYHHLVSV